MPLKTLVKVASITNLSDARYCAGMGVEMLGFSTVSGQKNYLSPEKFQEIRGWITGPLIVAEIYGIASQAELTRIIEDYKPDLLELSVAEYAFLSSIPLPFILNVEGDSVSSDVPSNLAYIRSSKIIKSPVPLLIDVQSKDEINLLLSGDAVKGIVLTGGAELKPGLKDFEVLNDVLEMLETED